MTHIYTQVYCWYMPRRPEKICHHSPHTGERLISIEHSSTFSIFKCALFFFFFLSIWNEQGLVSFGGRNLKGEVVGSRSQITQAPSSLEQLPLTQLLTLAAGSTNVLRSQEGWETKKELDSGYFWASMWQGDQKNKNPHLNPSLALPVWSWISYLTSLGLLSSSAIWRM